MKVVVAGGTGFVGKQLVKLLLTQEHKVVVLTTRRDCVNAPGDAITHSYWNPQTDEVDRHIFEGAGAVVNLGGYSIMKPWTKRNKQRMIVSRVQSTALLCKTLAELNMNHAVYVGVSGADVYRDTGELCTEDSPHDNGFPARLVQHWEAAAEVLDVRGIRKVIFRMPQVWAREGGAMAKLMAYYRWGLCVAFGKLHTPVSWVHIHDVLHSIHFAITQPEVSGVFNLSATEPATQGDVRRLLAHAMHRRVWLPPVPAWFLNFTIGERSKLLTSGVRLSNALWRSKGYVFRYNRADEAIAQIFSAG